MWLLRWEASIDCLVMLLVECGIFNALNAQLILLYFASRRRVNIRNAFMHKQKNILALLPKGRCRRSNDFFGFFKSLIK